MDEDTTLHQFYRRVFAGVAGQAVLADLEARAFVNETSFHPDPQRAAYNEGRRSLALHVRRMQEDRPARQQARQEEPPAGA